ncbi:MAG TPA: DUF1707 domain-containing protein [Streptosporangiaceae bacterium]|nr:DUF1707 domain-containing protein [Streptosporangiaceae bacterium]
MAYDPNIRASDADRDRAATLLREHHAAGRLTAEEFSDRLDRAFAAKTVGDIDGLLRDLPGIDLYRLPDSALTRQPRQNQPRRHSEAWRVAWGSWLTCSLLLFVIWALSGHGYLWPLWVAGPWGAILVGRWISGSHPQGGRRQVRGSANQDPGQLPRGDEDLPGRPGG